MAGIVDILFDFEPPENVTSAVLPLLPFHDFGRAREAILFVVQNTGGKPVHMIVESSEDGIIADQNLQDILIPAGQQGTWDAGDDLRSFWRLSVHTDGADTTTVKWRIKWRH